MNVQWQRHGHRLDIELAVALESAWRQMVRARSPRQLDAAIVYNLRLWRSIRALAERCPGMSEAEELMDVADHMAMMLVAEAGPSLDPRDVDFAAGRNLALSRDLAAEPAAQRARTELMARWAATGARASFDQWLLDRIGCAECPRPFGGGMCPPV